VFGEQVDDVGGVAGGGDLVAAVAQGISEQFGDLGRIVDEEDAMTFDRWIRLCRPSGALLENPNNSQGFRPGLRLCRPSGTENNNRARGNARYFLPV
jgi:hypothetical protein